MFDVSKHTLHVYRMPRVSAVTNLCATTIRNKLNPSGPFYDPDFPQPIKLGKSAIGWLSSEVEAWILSRPKATVLPPSRPKAVSFLKATAVNPENRDAFQ